MMPANGCLRFCVAIVTEVAEFDDFLTAAVKDDVADFFWQVLVRQIDIEVVMARQGLDDLEIVSVAPVPAAHRATGQADLGVAHHPVRIEELADTQAVALGTGAVRIIELKTSAVPVPAGCNRSKGRKSAR